MKTNKTLLLVHAVMLLGSMIATPGMAESSIPGAPVDNTLSATARLGLKVVIPRFLSFQVGSRGETIDTLTFEPAPNKVGDGSPVSATGGDAAGGSGTRVNLRSNAGQITLTASNDGGVGGLGSSGAISLADIDTLSDTPELAAPELTDAGGTASRTTMTRANVTDLAATWRYEYRNLHAVQPGSYQAEIVYTAASP